MKRLGYILYRIANDLVSLFSRALNAFVFGGSAVQAWAEEARVFVAWRDDVWTTAYALQAKHEADGTVPTIADVIAALPAWSA